ncbi:MAG: acetate kinase [Gallionellales bacterium GWA2_60_18]|nr:MAG: acetate kinase [Gallionellales bacterium GWA2_60_18]
MKTILTINSGSSSLKADLFLPDGTRRKFRYEQIGRGGPVDHAAAFDALMGELDGQAPERIGHRFVHGGDIAEAARLVDAAERERLGRIVHLAPLHLPGNLLGVDMCRERFDVPQIACFDTAFHATLPETAWRLPIPREAGLRRYGFHGLNYAHVASVLPELIGDAARGRVVVAHLGSGASLCLMENLRSVDTTMGYTPAGGIPMGTRSGDLDPGVMLELAQHHDHEELSDMVYHRMGLLALSDGENSEMSALLDSRSEAARFAVDYFCRQVRAAIGAMAARAGGIDALVFTAGIGEHAAPVREAICAPLDFMGFRLDADANRAHATVLNEASSRPILRIAADEEGTIYRLTCRFR